MSSARLTRGSTNSLVDVPGLLVGHETDRTALTGVTAVLVPGGAVGGVDVRGGAPGTRETDLLAPENLVDRVQGVVLAGGSAYGLAAASGVGRFLEEEGFGFPIGGGRVVPIVPAAVIFDLDVGDWRIRPDAEHGYRAARSASGAALGNGSLGAGTGARAGGLRGGVGGASAVMPDGTVVAALAVVNSLGWICDPVSGRLYAGDLELAGEFGVLPGNGRVEGPVAGGDHYEDLFPPGSSLSGRNTTIGVIATNARLGKAEAKKLAQMAHDGIARAIRPSHTPFDGDTIFSLATGQVSVGDPTALARLGSVAADVFARAVVTGVLAARDAPSHGAPADGKGTPPSYRQAFPGRLAQRETGE